METCRFTCRNLIVGKLAMISRKDVDHNPAFNQKPALAFPAILNDISKFEYIESLKNK